VSRRLIREDIGFVLLQFYDSERVRWYHSYCISTDVCSRVIGLANGQRTEIVLLSITISVILSASVCM